jgi:hypothetical protein
MSTIPTQFYKERPSGFDRLDMDSELQHDRLNRPKSADVDCRLDCLPYTELWPELAVQCPHSFNVCVTTEYDRVRCVSKKQSISSTFKVSVYIFIGNSLYIVCLNWINVCMWITPAAGYCD